MADITLLDQETIDKIAAGEVIDRPYSVVKELAENSMDAGATAVTIEIKDGGTSFIRITDNGCGIAKDQVALAFLRHSTSKIKSIEDLLTVSSLGFRGEALSSIAAVAQVELITKTVSELTGMRYVIEGSVEKEKEEIGAPDGTTILVHNLFYNTPARRKFLKSPQTEGGYISALAERLALSRPDISFRLISNNQTKLHTSGNSNAKDVIYQIYGREITSSLLEIADQNELFSVSGFIGKPVISRGNRNFENYFINRRYIRSSLLAKSIEDAYKSYLMQHQYPFCALYFTFGGELLDVNVHPSKMELRFDRQEEIYQKLSGKLREALAGREHIKPAALEHDTGKKDAANAPKKREAPPEPFEKKRLEKLAAEVRKDSPQGQSVNGGTTAGSPAAPIDGRPAADAKPAVNGSAAAPQPAVQPEYVQEELSYGGRFLSEQAKCRHQLIGQLFETYWLVEYDEKLYIIDQHAAHEKVLYEQTLRAFQKKDFTTQMVSPPMVLTLGTKEEQALKALSDQLALYGFEIEPFGGREYAVCGVPGNLLDLDARQLLLEILDSYEEIQKARTPELVLEKIASMSCKAAVKGRHILKRQEADALITELLGLENPYFCPHGRPTIISMGKYELEKKFKRIV